MRTHFPPVTLGLYCCLEPQIHRESRSGLEAPQRAARWKSVDGAVDDLVVAPGRHDAPLVPVVVGCRGAFGDGVGVPPVQKGAELGIAEVVEGYCEQLGADSKGGCGQWR
jgi:hypothetical protein